MSEAITLGDVPHALAAHPTEHQCIFRGIDAQTALRFRFEFTKLRSILRSTGQSILTPGELLPPDFYRSATFHEYYRPLNLYTGAVAVLSNSNGLIGGYPIWKASDAPPFSARDLEFISLALPSISHGLRTAQLLPAQPYNATDLLESSEQTEKGVVNLDAAGRVTSASNRALSLFAEIGVFDSVPADAFAAGQIKEGFAYISRLLAPVLQDDETGCLPDVAILSTRLGLSLKLQPFMTEDASGKRHITVLIDEQLPESIMCRRLQVIHSLSERESAVAVLLMRGLSRPQVALRLGVSLNTVKTYVRQIDGKLYWTTDRKLHQMIRQARPDTATLH